MTTITVTFDPPLPSDSPATFNSKAFDTLGDLNTWSGQANTVAGEVNTNATNAAASAVASASSASTSTTKAGEANASAVAAAASASSASTSAGTATTKASEADASAIAAAASAASIAPGSLLTAANPSYTGTLTGGTGVVNLGSGQVYKDASGNVCIGSASPASDARLTLSSPSTEPYLMFQRANTGVFDVAVGNNGGAFVIKGGADSSTVAGLTELVRVTSDGNFGLGVTPSAITIYKSLEVGRVGNGFYGSGSTSETVMLTGAYYNGGFKYSHTNGLGVSNYTQYDGTHTWTTAPSGTAGNPITFTQAMTLTSSGFLKASNNGDYSGNGLSSSGTYHQLVTNQTGGTGLAVSNTSIGAGVCVETYANTQASGFFYQGVGAGTVSYRVLTSGNVQNTNNSYGAISSRKLKDNIVDVSPKLAKLLQVRIVNYTLKADPAKAKLIGVVAEELEEVSPGLIEETPDYKEVKKTREVEVPAVEAVLDDEGNELTPAVEATKRTEEYTERVPLGTVTKSVKYSIFVPMLIKGMQEQQAQIEAMQAQLNEQNTAMQLLASRLAALEAAAT